MSNSDNSTNILNQSLDQVMSDRFGRYSKYIIQERALPDVRDGLKPVQRRIIYSMSELGLLANKPFKKSARVVGEVIGKYHPHGDSSIYEAMVRMSQSWKMNVPLIQMHGNNGSIDDDPAAAMRYTEARLSEISNLLINDIKKDTVLFSPNFDDSEKEPTVLPGLFPNLMVNGARGIAAGYATEMPPHNLGEVINGIIAKIKSPNIRLETMLNYIKGPDFPTGGTVLGQSGIFEAFERGRGKIAIRSTYEISDQKKKPYIKITEIPFGVVKSKLVRAMDELRINNKIDGIKEVRDETDRNGLTIMIEITPGKEVKPILNYLLAKTEMQVYYNYNNISIKDKVPKQMSILSLIDAYLAHQNHVQKKALNYSLNKDKMRLEIVEGLIRVAKISDEIIDVIKSTKESKKGVVQALMQKFEFTHLQANAIAELRLYRLSQTDQSLYIDEKNLLTERVAKVAKILSSEGEFDSYLIDLLRVLKRKYATLRKTNIIEEIGSINIDMDKLIKHENIWVGISQKGYTKRFSNRVYESNDLGSYFLNKEDTLVSMDFLNTRDRLIIFTSKGNYYSIPAHKLIETKFKDIGKHLNDFAALSPSEYIVSTIIVEDFSVNNVFITLITKNGKGKRVEIKSFDNTRFTRLYRAIKLQQNDQLIAAKVSNGHSVIVVVNKDGKAVNYSESQLPVQSTSSSGVKAMSLGKSWVASFGIVQRGEQVGIISSRGGIKRVKLSDIPAMSRTTMGKELFRTIKGNPHIPIDLSQVNSKSLAYFSNNGIILKHFNEVEITTRNDGFSLLGFSQSNGGYIKNRIAIRKTNSFFNEPKELSQEEKFAKAEKSIESIAQIDIDDLLKDNN